MQTYQLPENPAADEMQAAHGRITYAAYLLLAPEQQRARRAAAAAIPLARWNALSDAERRALTAFAEARVEQALAAAGQPDIATLREDYPLSAGYPVDAAIEEVRAMVLDGGYADDELVADVSGIDADSGEEDAVRREERAYQRGQDAWGWRGGL